MNKNIAVGKWQQLKGSIQQTWGELTDDDVAQAHGSAQKLAGILQEKYGYAQQDAEEQIKAFWEKNKDK